MKYDRSFSLWEIGRPVVWGSGVYVLVHKFSKWGRWLALSNNIIYKIEQGYDPIIYVHRSPAYAPVKKPK